MWQRAIVFLSAFWTWARTGAAARCARQRAQSPAPLPRWAEVIASAHAQAAGSRLPGHAGRGGQGTADRDWPPGAIGVRGRHLGD